MPSSGLSLVGFMDEAAGMNHLRTACLPPDPADDAVRATWKSAQANCSATVQNAGLPEILDIPATHLPYIVALAQTPMVAQAMQTYSQGASFKLIEIDPLLAYQHTVDLDYSTVHCKGLSKPPTIDELLPVCLPLAVQLPSANITPGGQSLLVKTRALNLTTLAGGVFQEPNKPTIAGIMIGPTLPLVHVVRLNGRCYLHNGFHRAVGAKLAGATHVPCLFRDVPTEESAGIRQDGSTFSAASLNSANPPTVGHFSLCAEKVQLRARSRILHLSWAEYIAYDE